MALAGVDDPVALARIVSSTALIGSIGARVSDRS